MSILRVNSLDTRTGTDISITAGKTITGTASQFKITGGASGQAILTDGAGNLTFGAVDALPTQSGQAGKFLKTDGTDPSWSNLDPDAFPSQTGKDGWILTTDGTNVVWSDIINSAPAALDTLNELAASLADDADFAGTMTTALAGKEPTLTAGTTAQYYRGDKTWQTLTVDPTMGGDLTGTASNAQIAANAVGLAEMAGLVRGKIIVGDASGDPSALAMGTSEQVLRVNNAGTDLEYADAVGGAAGFRTAWLWHVAEALDHASPGCSYCWPACDPVAHIATSHALSARAAAE